MRIVACSFNIASEFRFRGFFMNDGVYSISRFKVQGLRLIVLIEINLVRTYFNTLIPLIFTYLTSFNKLYLYFTTL